MASSIVGVSKHSAQLQMVMLDYGDEKGLKHRKNNGWESIKGSKRERTEIIAEILLHCNQHKTKTNIMHRVNLNYAQLKKHLESLTSQGLLLSDDNLYATTQKGYRFLRLFAQLNDMLES